MQRLSLALAAAAGEADALQVGRLWESLIAASLGQICRLGDHVFMEVECSAKNVRDKASFKVAAAAVAAQDAGGASGCSGNSGGSSSSSSSSDMQHLVWMFLGARGGQLRECPFLPECCKRPCAAPQLQCKLQELCSDKISSILHVLQLSESSSAALDAGCSRD
jgi:hypothetical protein